MIGFDAGTYNLVACKRDKDKNFVHNREVNAFIELPTENKFVFNMMKAAGVSLIERPEAKLAYALGEAAVKIAYTMDQVELKRPMSAGCLNPKEKNAQQIMSIMIHSLLGELQSKEEILYYTVPANAVNEDTDALYHGKVLQAIFDAYTDEKGNKVKAFPINEALCLTYAELKPQNYTGITCSFGSGMVNVCFAIFGNPVFQFSVVNSGDFIDRQAAKATGETPTFINQEKMKLDLTVNPESMVQKAIKAQYEIMVMNTVTEIKHGIEKAGKKARNDKPIDIVIAGGTSLPKGFDALFDKTIRSAALPIDIGKVIRPADPLYSVARGALLAAEASV